MKGLLAVRRQQGQSLVESIVVIPVFGVLLLGIFQAILLYRAKTVLDYAALQAARAGAVDFAEMNAMRTGLARGLMPLYTHNASIRAATKAYAKAQLDVRTGGAVITIVSPTREAFDDWKEIQFDGVEAIPNDALPFRSSTVKNRSHLSVQDANVLKIRVTYRYPLIVPVIDRIIGTFDALRSGASRLSGSHRKVYSLTIQADAMVRMQTPIRDRNLLADASAGTAGGGSGGGGGVGSGETGSGGGSGSGSAGGGGGSGTPPPPKHVCL